MNDHTTEDISRHVKVYITVFVALMALTLITVVVSYLHLSMAAAVLIALAIASVKGSLVACFFMHLISEKKLIYCVLILAAIFFAALLFFPVYDTQHASLPAVGNA